MSIRKFISLLLITIILSTIGCKNSNEKKLSKNKNLKYSEIEIYCWCFLDTTALHDKNGAISTQVKDCEVIIPLNPSDFVKAKHLFYFTSSPDTIEAIRKLVFDRKESSKPINNSIDTRFLILFKKDNFKADTIIYYYGKLCYNEKYLFNYSFNIMDSIRNILNVKKIDCTSD